MVTLLNILPTILEKAIKELLEDGHAFCSSFSIKHDVSMKTGDISSLQEMHASSLQLHEDVA